MSRSATWDAAYAALKRGEQLALPFYAPRAVDDGKQTRLSEAYRRFQRGELPARDLPDLSDIFPDDPQVRAAIGLQTAPGATPAEALIQACCSCHNDVLDQNVSRALSIRLAAMGTRERERAVERILRSTGEAGVMPLQDARALDARARDALVAYLRSATRTPEDDRLLDRAARLGMAVLPDGGVPVVP